MESQRHAGGVALFCPALRPSHGPLASRGEDAFATGENPAADRSMTVLGCHCVSQPEIVFCLLAV